MDNRDLTVQERELRQKLKQKLLGLSSLERSIARQRSRILYLKEGDGNTRLFHQSACHRQRKNMIYSLTNGDSFASGHEEIANMVDSYYTNLLGVPQVRPNSIDLTVLDLPFRDLAHLDLVFSEEEVEKVVKSIPRDKAPGPDGFTGRFYATCWHVIKGDLMRAFGSFFRGDMNGLAAINKAIVSLLPKIDGASDIRDFRPVSLVHGAIKIFVKALANQLALELPGLVGMHQSAFVKGRSIHDNSMLVQCTARRLNALKEPAVMLKLDISKAFDSVQWPFLVQTMRAMGFGPRWMS